MSGTVHLGRTVPTQDRNGRTHLLLGTPPWRCIRIMRRGLLACPPPSCKLMHKPYASSCILCILGLCI